MVKTIVDEGNLTILEAEPDDFIQFLLEEYREAHPEVIARHAFREDVMGLIGSDHHKSRDGCMSISYDYYSETWHFFHPGYVRHEILVKSKSFLDGAQQFLRQIRKANARVLNQGIIDAVNGEFPDDISIELEEKDGWWHVAVYRCENGENWVRLSTSIDGAGKSAAEIAGEVKAKLHEEPF